MAKPGKSSESGTPKPEIEGGGLDAVIRVEGGSTPATTEDETPEPPVTEDWDEWDAFEDQPDTGIFEATQLLDESPAGGSTEIGRPAADSTKPASETPDPDTSDPKLGDSDLEFLKNSQE